MNDWLTELKFQCQTSGTKRQVACNPDDAERIQAAAEAAGLADLVTIESTHVIPRGHAWVPDTRNLDEGFYAALGIRRFL